MLLRGKHKIALHKYRNTTHKTQKYESDKHILDYTTMTFIFFTFAIPLYLTAETPCEPIAHELCKDELFL